MARSSQRKGRAGELELCRILSGYGYDVQPGVAVSFGSTPDIVGLPGVHEVKRREQTDISAALKQASEDAQRFGDGNSCGGRKPIPEDLREAFQLLGHDALEMLRSVMLDENARNADRIKAAEIILDRGYGRPRQALDFEPSDNGGGIIILPARMDDEEVE